MDTYEGTLTLNTTPSYTNTIRILQHAEPSPQPRRTKIVCTLGPSSTDPERILDLVNAGMDCARLNFSHGKHEDHAARIAAVRRAEAIADKPISLLADLCGPKIRIAQGFSERLVAAGDEIILTGADVPQGDEIPVTFPGLAEAVATGDPVLVEDGRIRAVAITRDGPRLHCLVEVGGTIKEKKGVNIPRSAVAIPSLTDKDREDLAFALAQGVDHVALSFVQHAKDVLELKELIRAAGSTARVVAKIEKAEALEDLEEIVDASDAIMVARGDLGVEVGVHDVPLAQKRMIGLARAKGRTVITATQMLESMIDAPGPTRAEVSDVANAIIDGTSAIMLSAETASGSFPVEAVQVMDRIARTVEPSLALPVDAQEGDPISVLSDTACRLADGMEAAAIAVHTETGATAREIARFRPPHPIVAASTSDLVRRQLALEWGVIPVAAPRSDRIEDAWSALVRQIEDRSLAAAGDTIVLAGRADLPVPGVTTNITVHQLSEAREA
jgi:pyruvate kinase